MKPERATHARLRLTNALFTVLLLTAVALSGWLSTRYRVESDWTSNTRNSLSPTSLDTLARVRAPLVITSYTRESSKALRAQITDLIDRYQRVSPHIHLEFVNPDTHPDQVRNFGVSLDGELRLNYQERSEQVRDFGESTLTAAIHRLLQTHNATLAFLNGHGERRPDGTGNADLGQFTRALTAKGVRILPLNLAQDPKTPDPAHILVLASPRTPLLPGEIALIRAHITQGGALLWLAEPGAPASLKPLADDLGVSFLPGVVVDAQTQLLGLSSPTFAVVTDYLRHPVTDEIATLTLFPEATALETRADGAFRYTRILRTQERAWTETGPIEGAIRPDAARGERTGPLTLGVALSTRSREKTTDHEQRLAVLGDGDFLSNAHLGNGANLELGIRLIEWLDHADSLLSIPARPVRDSTLSLSSTQLALIGTVFLILLPLGLFGTAGWIWLRRRRL